MTICVLGRQPALGLAELESLYGSDKVQALGKQAALVTIDPKEINHRRLGGVIKVAKPLTILPSQNWSEITSHIKKELPNHLQHIPEGKLKLGVSLYDIQAHVQKVNAFGLELKKIVRQTGRSVRIIPNSTISLSSAQVLHNQLTSPLGIELVCIAFANKTYLAQTVSVQNIDEYSRRDFNRPKRDAFVGMLPPKLAQIMLNLAQTQPNMRVLDPFCGSGVVLQEAALLGCAVYGSDVSERMVRYTRDNLNWLQDIYNLQFDKYLEVTDATTAIWQQPINTVVCETYLGQPLSGLPHPEKLQEIIDQCNTITTKFLQNLKPQLAQHTRICLAVPAWHTKNGFQQLPVIDDLKKMGYNRVSFSCANNQDLIYHRKEQVVARQLLVLTV